MRVATIVLVKIDDQSLRDVGRWPWPRREVGQITNRLTAAGAKRIFFDLTFLRSDQCDRRPDVRRRSPCVENVHISPSGRARVRTASHNRIPRRSRNFANICDAREASAFTTIIRTLSGICRIRSPSVGKTLPSFAAELAGRTGAAGTPFMPDYSIDPASIPTYLGSRPCWSATFDPRARPRQGRRDRHGPAKFLATNISFPAPASWAAPMYISSALRPSRRVRRSISAGSRSSLRHSHWSHLPLRQRSSARQTLLLTCGASVLLFGARLARSAI